MLEMQLPSNDIIKLISSYASWVPPTNTVSDAQPWNVAVYGAWHTLKPRLRVLLPINSETMILGIHIQDEFAWAFEIILISWNTLKTNDCLGYLDLLNVISWIRGQRSLVFKHTPSRATNTRKSDVWVKVCDQRRIKVSCATSQVLN